MKFELERTVLISDTDAAGVMFFGRYPVFFHDAYELGLKAHGVNLMERATVDGIMLPVTHLDVEYRRPLRAGETIRIELQTSVEGEDRVIVAGSIWKETDRGTKEATRYRATHTCVSLETGRRAPFPPFWVELFA